MTTLTAAEKLLKFVGGIPFPFGFMNVPANYTRVIFQLGKYDRQIESGLRWRPPVFSTHVDVFKGTLSYDSKSLNLLDKSGNPIIINSIVMYSITNPLDYVLSTNYSQNDIVNKKIDMQLRQVLGKYHFINDSEEDIRSCGNKLKNELIDNIQSAVEPNGINITDVNINEARYAPSVAQQMLIKQQAQAYIDARRLIVKGALDTVADVNSQLDWVTTESKEKTICNLITVLASQHNAQPVVELQ